jgi:hypothetical protein
VHSVRNGRTFASLSRLRPLSYLLTSNGGRESSSAAVLLKRTAQNYRADAGKGPQAPSLRLTHLAEGGKDTS